jgi:PAS domain S-box-containing protein
MKISDLNRLFIGRRLTLCFALIVALMLAGNAGLLWQFQAARAQVDRLTGVGEEYIAVGRLQATLDAFYDDLDALAHVQDVERLKSQAEPLRARLLQGTKEARETFARLPKNMEPDPVFLPTVEAIESALPSQMDAISMLAATGDWGAVRLRLANEKRPLQTQTSALAKNIAQEVNNELAESVLSIKLMQQRTLLILGGTALVTLLIAGLLGVVVTRSITEPLAKLVEGSEALAKGEFKQEVVVGGEDELSQLGEVFNDMARKLEARTADLRRSEGYLREAQRLSRAGSFAWVVATKTTYWSTELYRILGYDPATTEASVERFLEKVHPEDRAMMAVRVDIEATGRADSEAHYRILLADGTVRHLHSVAHPVLNAAGEVAEVVGTTMDVTEQHNARLALQKAIEEIERLKEQLHRENIALREEVDKVSMFEEIVGSSRPLRKVLGEVAKVAATESTVLILGETGTGKEMIARAIHRRSQRSARAFIRVNCAAIPPTLIASELFGHEKGAFTGANQRRLGRFELADGGTIFLDEIGELPMDTQSVLLRVLQEREFERVGGTKAVSVDVRVLSATNRDLKGAVAAGIFRQDLFYRLNVFPIQMPPLRDRKDDIPLLVEYLIERYSKKAGKTIRNIEKRTMDLLSSYRWPGNVRELQNVVERAVVLCEGDTFTVEESWLKREAPATELDGLDAEGLAGLDAPMRTLGRLLPDDERQIIEAALAECRGRVSGPSGAAARLGIPRQTLESKIATLKIDKYKYKSA